MLAARNGHTEVCAALCAHGSILNCVDMVSIFEKSRTAIEIHLIWASFLAHNLKW